MDNYQGGIVGGLAGYNLLVIVIFIIVILQETIGNGSGDYQGGIVGSQAGTAR